MSADSLSLTFDSDVGDVLRRKPKDDHPEFDITAMIDLVFMMNIYFLVGFVGAIASELDLPSATHAVALDAEAATIILVQTTSDPKQVKVILGNDKEAAPIVDADDQEQQIAAAAEAGVAAGKKAVLIKAEKGVRLREIHRLGAAASVEGATLHLAVLEKEG